MNQSLLKYTFLLLSMGLLGSVGCTPAKQPTGPAEGSVQAYLDENPEAAARIDEDFDDGTDDGTGE